MAMANSYFIADPPRILCALQTPCLTIVQQLCRSLQWQQGNTTQYQVRANVLIFLYRYSFQFLNLPRDVRYIIYDYLVKPFQHHSSRMFVSLHSIPPELDMDSAVARPDVNFYPTRGGTSSEFRILTSMAAVNHQVRAEIGSSFWKDVHLFADLSSLTLIDFLKNRPAIHRGIKSLSLSWKCQSVPYHVYKVVETCNYLADHLALGWIILNFNTTLSISRKIEELHGSLPCVHALR
jgi:hypothetical protein